MSRELTPEERRAEIESVFHLLMAGQSELSVVNWLVSVRDWPRGDAERFVEGFVKFIPVMQAPEPAHARMQRLHTALDVLSAQFLEDPANKGKLPSTTTMLELMEWSHRRLTGKPRPS